MKKNMLVALALVGGMGAGVLGMRVWGDAMGGSAKAPEMKMPAGWTEDDMKACMAAGTPGKQHEQLMKHVGQWNGKSTMWMGSGGEESKSECTSVITGMMGGKFTKCETSGEMPGMGKFEGFGLYGYDNVAGKYYSTWIDNMGTGMMQGTGTLSADGKVMTWNYTFHCPIAKKPVVMREVETYKSDNEMTLEMFGPDPKTGKEYRMMVIEFARSK